MLSSAGNEILLSRPGPLILISASSHSAGSRHQTLQRNAAGLILCDYGCQSRCAAAAAKLDHCCRSAWRLVGSQSWHHWRCFTTVWPHQVSCSVLLFPNINETCCQIQTHKRLAACQLHRQMHSNMSTMQRS